MCSVDNHGQSFADSNAKVVRFRTLNDYLDAYCQPRDACDCTAGRRVRREQTLCDL